MTQFLNIVANIDEEDTESRMLGILRLDNGFMFSSWTENGRLRLVPQASTSEIQ